MHRTLVLRALVVGVSALAYAGGALMAQSTQSALSDSVDAYVHRHMTSERIPGMAVAVMKAGQVVHMKGYGLANVEHQVPVTTRTVFQSGSVGKAFTVMAVMMLVDEGTVGLDDTLTTWFPDAPKTWRAITVRHLLQHTSGLPGYPDDFDFRRDRTEAELYEIIKAQPLEFAVGERRGYSNLGFVLLGILVHKATGMFYGDFLQQRIFAPLGMNTARVISEADIVHNRAAGYRMIDSTLANQEWVAPSLNTTADGALYLSVEDMAKWEAALHRGALLSAPSYERMWSRLVTNDGMVQPWGFSWLVADVHGQRLLEHSGGWQGFGADVVRVPGAELAVAVFVNRRGVNPVEPARRVLEIYQPELSIAGASVMPEVEPTVAAFVHDLIKRIADTTLSRDMFAGSGADDILPGEQQAADEFRAYGPLRRAELVGREELPDGSRMLQYRLTFDTRQVVLMFSLDARNRITAIELRRR
jgi:CubicO group peptidase (beta-lactamase class C family)